MRLIFSDKRRCTRLAEFPVLGSVDPRVESPTMTRHRISLSQMMIIIALFALNLALLKILPRDSLLIPTFWILLAVPNFVIIWKLLLRRECRAFHYTFFVVLLPVFAILANLTARESLQILHILVGRFGGIVLDPRRNMQLYEVVHFGEFWLDATLAVLLAWSAGMLAAWLERRRGWDIAAFWRGALIGLLSVCVVATIDDGYFREGQPPQGTLQIASRWTLVASFMIVGGALGLSRLRSRGFNAADPPTAPPAPAG
jgi:hypothetical protein